MLTKRDRTAAHKALEEVQRRRAGGITLCMERAGSWKDLATMAAMNENLLIMMGNGTRAVTEIAARRFEVALGLPLAWLDEKH